MGVPPGTPDQPLHVAVVGSGPSGFYAAEALLQSGLAVQVDLIERLPVPYGLVRYGVAPDHAKLKSVTATFAGIAEDPRLRFFGNVALGRDVTVEFLSATYHAVIVATGADADRRLGIEGENLQGVHAASDFVGWYNGKPEAAGLQFDLSQEVAVVVGHGNVAIDVCRILAKPVSELRGTDIAGHALEALAGSRVREIHLVGRRGPVQARFTPKELRELGTLEGWQPVLEAACLEVSQACLAELASPASVHEAKNLGILRGFAARVREACKPIHLHFHQAPVALRGDDRLREVVLEEQELAGPAGLQVAVPTGRLRRIGAGLLFRSVGYRSTPLPGLPFDDRRGVLPHRDGRLTRASGEVLTGWYATGWIKRGPTGIIGTNRLDSVETVARLLEDLTALAADKPGRAGLLATLQGRRHVDFEDWLRIERAERERGASAGKVAEKFSSVPEMLAAAGLASGGPASAGPASAATCG
jgi:ferredoxin--NADP+ reductase